MDLPIEQLPPAFRARLEAVRRVARRRGEAAWLVGGPVRDLLLGQPLADLDVTVEGDGAVFARELSREVGGKARTHEAFGTGEVTAPDGLRVDVATARTEQYAAPAALPKVTPAALADDLSRRDFTVNALAWSVATGEGEVIDLFGGLEDLARRQLRVLHPGSFRDDPTRILRAVRLGARLGFEMEPETRQLAHRALDDGVLEHLSPARLRQELRLLLDDPSVVADGLRDLERLGLLTAIHPRLVLGDDGVARIRDVVTAWRELDGSSELWTAGLLTMVRMGEWDEKELRGLARRLGLEGSAGRLLETGPTRQAIAVEALGRAAVPSERYRALEPLLDAELLVLAADRDGDVARAARWMVGEARALELGVSGGDLVADGVPPGPWVGRALEEVRDALLDGRVELSSTRELAVETAGQLRAEATAADRAPGGASIAAVLVLVALLFAGCPSLVRGQASEVPEVSESVSQLPQLSERSIVRFRLDCGSDLGRKEITLFGNGTVRLREQRPDEEEKLYLGELEPAVLEGYLARIEDEDLSETDRRPLVVDGPWVERCTLDLLPRGLEREDTQRFQVSRYQSLSLALSRVLAVGDELSEHVLSVAGPGLPLDYVPARGDRLVRPDGVVFEVVRRTGDGTGLEMRGVDVPLTVYVPIGQLREVYARLVERGEDRLHRRLGAPP